MKTRSGAELISPRLFANTFAFFAFKCLLLNFSIAKKDASEACASLASSAFRVLCSLYLHKYDDQGKEHQ